MSIHVFPTAPSPTTTHFMSRSVLAILEERKSEGERERERERERGRERRERERDDINIQTHTMRPYCLACTCSA